MVRFIVFARRLTGAPCESHLDVQGCNFVLTAWNLVLHLSPRPLRVSSSHGHHEGTRYMWCFEIRGLTHCGYAGIVAVLGGTHVSNHIRKIHPCSRSPPTALASSNSNGNMSHYLDSFKRRSIGDYIWDYRRY